MAFGSRAVIVGVLVTAAAGGAGLVIGGGGGGGAQSCPALPAFPDAACTGVPAGTSLTTPTLDGEGNYVINTPNAVVDGVDVSASSPSSSVGCIVVLVTGVTIKNSKMRCLAMGNSADSPTASPRLQIQDSEIDCQRDPVTNQGPSTGMGAYSFDALRLDVRGCENGFDIEQNASLTDSYIHDLSQCKTFNCVEPDAHTDGIQSGDSSGLSLVHNNISVVNLPCPDVDSDGNGSLDSGDGRCAGTGSINLNHNPLTGTYSNTLIKDNLLLGGSEWIYCPVATTVNWVVTHNYLSNAWHSPDTAGCANEDAGDNVVYQTGAHFALQ